jgi:hypothetical protein
MEKWRNDADRERQALKEKAVTVSLYPPQITGLGLNPGLRGDRPATDSLIHGTAFTLRPQ